MRNENILYVIFLSVIIVLSIVSISLSINAINRSQEILSYREMQQEAWEKDQEEQRRIGEWLDYLASFCDNHNITMEVYY